MRSISIPVYFLFGLLVISISPLMAEDLSGLAQIKSGCSKAISSAHPDPNNNADRIKYIKPGETKVLADITRAGGDPSYLADFQRCAAELA